MTSPISNTIHIRLYWSLKMKWRFKIEMIEKNEWRLKLFDWSNSDLQFAIANFQCINRYKLNGTLYPFDDEYIVKN